MFHSSGFHHICNIKYRLDCRYSPQNIFNAKNFNPHKKPISLFNVPICTQGMQRTWWPEAGTIIVTGPYWGRVTHICVSKLTTIGSDNGLSPGRRQAIIWANAEILLIGPLGINFNEILIKINRVSFNKMYLKMSSAKWCLFRLGLNELITTINCIPHMLPVYQSHVLHCSLPLQYHPAYFIIIYCDFVYSSLYTWTLKWKKILSKHHSKSESKSLVWFSLWSVWIHRKCSVRVPGSRQ